MAGNVQQLREIGGLLRPPRILPLFFLLSHKAIRSLVPFAMVAMLAANVIWLCKRPQPIRCSRAHRFTGGCSSHKSLFTCSRSPAHCGSCGLACWHCRYYFTMINMAVFFGWYYASTSRLKMSWE